MLHVALAAAAVGGFSSEYGQILTTKALLNQEMRLVREEIKRDQVIIDRLLTEWNKLNVQIERMKRHHQQGRQVR